MQFFAKKTYKRLFPRLVILDFKKYFQWMRRKIKGRIYGATTLSITMLSAIMLSDVAPYLQHSFLP